MPLVKRLISPIQLSRVDKIDPHTSNELELVSNHSLANVIRQLSSLSRNAEDMFAELSNEANKVLERTQRLHERVSKVHQKVSELDANVEEVPLNELSLLKQYQSAVAPDQQVVARNTIPTAIVATYLNSEPPPPLTKLNIYREDQKDSLKFYTDPGYFFDLWYQEMQKEMEQKKKEYREKKQHKRRPRVQVENKEVRAIKTRRDEYKDRAMGEEFSQAFQAMKVKDANAVTQHVAGPASNDMVNQHSNHQPQHLQNRRSHTSRHMNGPISQRVSHSEVPQQVTSIMDNSKKAHNSINEAEHPASPVL